MTTPAIRLEWAALTDRGLRRRGNEDAWTVVALGEGWTPLAAGLSPVGPGGVLLIVSDGIGGSNAGEEASQFCVEHLPVEVACRRDQPDRKAALADAMQATHAALSARSRTRSDWQGMGATLTVLWLLSSGPAILGHVGDSRLYHRHGGRWRQCSEDHSVGAGMVRRGELTPEAVSRMKFRSVLEQAMGGDGVEIQPQVAEVEIAAGDYLLLCSDGAYGPNESHFLTWLGAKETPAPAAFAAELVAAANAAGGPDNITVICARVPGA